MSSQYLNSYTKSTSKEIFADKSIETLVQSQSSVWAAGDLSDISSVSGDWNSTYITVSNLSGIILENQSDLEDFVVAASAWNSTYTTVNTVSSVILENQSDLEDFVVAASAWNSTQTTVNANSAIWNENKLDITEVALVSANWNSVVTDVNATSANWDSVYTIVQTNSASDWDNTGLTSEVFVQSNFVNVSGDTMSGDIDLGANSVIGLSSLEFDNFAKIQTNDLGDIILQPVQRPIGASIIGETFKVGASASGDVEVWGDFGVTGTMEISGNITTLNGLVSTIGGDSDDWNSNYTIVNVTSGDWNSTYTTVNATSAQIGINQDDITNMSGVSGDWDSVYTSFNANSADFAKMPAQIVTVATSGANFTSIKDAVESLTTDTNNRAAVLIYPGNYYEDNPVYMPPYTTINCIGSHETTKMYCNNKDLPGIDVSKDSELFGMQVLGCSGSYGFCISGTAYDIDFHDCKVKDAYDGWLVSSTGQSIVIRSGLITGGTFENIIHVVSGANISVNDLHVASPVVSQNIIYVDGENSNVNLNSSILNGDNSTDAIRCTNNGTAQLVGVHINNVDNAIHILSEGVIRGTGVDVGDSTNHDILTEGDGCRVIMSGSNLDQTTFEISSGTEVIMGYIDELEGDEGFKILGELSVGSPERPSESIFGEGDSYTTDLQFYRSDAGTLIQENVSLSATNINDGLLLPIFLNGVVGDEFYVASDKRISDYLQHPGFKYKLTTAPVANSLSAIATEFYNGVTWEAFNYLVTESGNSYFPKAQDFGTINGSTNGSYQLRYDHTISTSSVWQTTTIGTGEVSEPGRYWTRFRVQEDLVTVPVVDQIKLHSNRLEINNDGFIEMFGKARVYQSLGWSARSIPGGSALASDNIAHSQNLIVNGKENVIANTADDYGFDIILPPNLDTSSPIRFRVSFTNTNNSATTLGYNIRYGTTEPNSNVTIDGDSGNANASIIDETLISGQSIVIQPDTLTWLEHNLFIPNALARRSGGYPNILALRFDVTSLSNPSAVIVQLAADGVIWSLGEHI